MNKTVVNMERIVAKIDNDFNPDNSDWIPRVAAWTMDALSILKCFKDQINRRKVEVTERIAFHKCAFINLVKIYDSNGCEVKALTSSNCSCDNNGSFFTGESNGANSNEFVKVGGNVYRDTDTNANIDTNLDIEITKSDEPPTYLSSIIRRDVTDKNYVQIDDCKIELNFDTKFIVAESKGIQTEYSEVFGCDLPVIPDNGLLIECITFYCMYKMLCRGYKHPIFNLRDNSPALNPYIFWIQNKDRAKDSVIIDLQKDNDGNLWRSAFYIETFDPLR